jgi:ribosomal protein L16/L10AE
MKQNPSRLKFRKNHKVSYSFFTIKDNKTFFPMHGNFALKSIDPGKLTLKQIEAGRKSIRRNVKKKDLFELEFSLLNQLLVNL